MDTNRRGHDPYVTGVAGLIRDLHAEPIRLAYRLAVRLMLGCGAGLMALMTVAARLHLSDGPAFIAFAGWLALWGGAVGMLIGWALRWTRPLEPSREPAPDRVKPGGRLTVVE